MPRELQALREIRDAEALLAQISDADEQDRTLQRLLPVQIRLAEGRGRGLAFAVEVQHCDRLLESLRTQKGRP